MVSAIDVPADALIAAVSADLKENIEMPKWAKYVKTGSGRQRPPEQEDWWWTRAAAVLRKIYLQKGPVGVSRLRTAYGNRKDMGVQPAKTVKASGKVIREVLRQLEELGYLEKTDKGRVITPKGQSYLDQKAKSLGGTQSGKGAE